MNVLFLCVANSARSQLAEGLARKAFGAQHRFFSAGSKPSKINPYAVRALAEVGIDASEQFSKRMEDIDLPSIDLIITLCAEEVCPLVPGKTRTLHWPFPDPAGDHGSETDKIERFRAARDSISKKLEELSTLFRDPAATHE